MKTLEPKERVSKFFQAIRDQDITFIKKELESGYHIDAQNSNGVTAIMVATNSNTKYRNVKIIELLISYKPDYTLKNIMNNTVFDTTDSKGKNMLNSVKVGRFSKLIREMENKND